MNIIYIMIALMMGTIVSAQAQDNQSRNWQDILEESLPVLGHRNFIVIADSAYPQQSNPGIKTVYTGAGQLEVVEKVINAVEKADHVSGTIYVDQELNFVPEENAPGIDKYRTDLNNILGNKNVLRLPHIDIINKLDQSSDLFNVLILKTDLTIPYTSVFIELGAGYWNDQAEAELRESMK
ncbi:MAG: hypothetical protein HOH19_07130 [Kordiimonadaceae bacterium]|jgi:hypothetical protein|nr:hypothetical protein [Kordiimonadaceae bacterium]MBT6032331.1 hypothetical protein [Kordiimonadaceae bacterium]